jgi:hypothetical protein
MVTARRKQLTKEQKVMKSRDVAYLLDCSPDDVILLAQKGKLKAHKNGKYWRYRLDDVLEFKRERAAEQKKAEKAARRKKDASLH